MRVAAAIVMLNIAVSSCSLLCCAVCSYAIKKKDELERVAKANR
jgi:ribosomal protein S7